MQALTLKQNINRLHIHIFLKYGILDGLRSFLPNVLPMLEPKPAKRALPRAAHIFLLQEFSLGLWGFTLSQLGQARRGSCFGGLGFRVLFVVQRGFFESQLARTMVFSGVGSRVLFLAPWALQGLIE